MSNIRIFEYSLYRLYTSPAIEKRRKGIQRSEQIETWIYSAAVSHIIATCSRRNFNEKPTWIYRCIFMCLLSTIYSYPFLFSLLLRVPIDASRVCPCIVASYVNVKPVFASRRRYIKNSSSFLFSIRAPNLSYREWYLPLLEHANMQPLVDTTRPQHSPFSLVDKDAR